MTATIPPHRRAEGLGYWGLASVFAIATAPAIGFWVYQHGWVLLCVEITILNLLMAVIAWRLPDDHHDAPGHDVHPAGAPAHPPARVIEWRVLLLSVSMALISFGYGSLTSFSALFADALHVTPRSLFLTAMAASILVGRLTIGRSLDRLGHRPVLVRSLLAPPLGLALLALAQGWWTFLFAALVFGAGFGLMYPAFSAYVLAHVPSRRRGAAFGAMLAAFDTGIGTGSTAMGWLITHVGFRGAFGAAAGVAVLSLPIFLYAERRLGFRASE
jgi:MFS family permease